MLEQLTLVATNCQPIPLLQRSILQVEAAAWPHARVTTQDE